jgi:hypothetical protein
VRKLFLLLASCLSLVAFADSMPEYDMKATFTYNFAAYTEWPESSRGNFNVCTLNEEDIGQALRKFEGKSLHGRRLVIARLSSLGAINQCQVLYIGERESSNLPRILSQLGDAPVMTVSDVPALSSVCMLLSLEGTRLVFDVNLEPCRQAKLKPSSTLLRLARSVKKLP